jgi:hypothetical protein
MRIRRWLLGACVIAGLGCPAGSDNAQGPVRKPDASSSDDDDAGPSGASHGKSTAQCPPTQVACGTGCIPKLAACCDSGSYCTNNAGGGCDPTRTCRAAFPSGATANYCCAENADIGSNDCPPGQHHCGLGCRAVTESCCSRTTDFCTPEAAADGGEMNAATDAGSTALGGSGGSSFDAGVAGGGSDARPDGGSTLCCCTFEAEHYCGTRYDPCWTCVQTEASIDGYLCGESCNAPVEDQCVTTCGL